MRELLNLLSLAVNANHLINQRLLSIRLDLATLLGESTIGYEIHKYTSTAWEHRSPSPSYYDYTARCDRHPFYTHPFVHQRRTKIGFPVLYLSSQF